MLVKRKQLKVWCVEAWSLSKLQDELDDRLEQLTNPYFEGAKVIDIKFTTTLMDYPSTGRPTLFHCAMIIYENEVEVEGDIDAYEEMLSRTK